LYVAIVRRLLDHVRCVFLRVCGAAKRSVFDFISLTSKFKDKVGVNTVQIEKVKLVDE
jgi:hypothetical protein